MRPSHAFALAAPSLALVAAACQCVGGGPDLYACPSGVQDCAWCDRDGRCAILADGGLADDGGSQPSDAGDGGSTCSPPGATLCAPDGGCWEHPLPQGNDLVGIWGAGGAVWAVGTAGTILRWDGTAWARIPSGTTSDLLSVWTDSAGEAWVSGASGQWFRITAQGARSNVAGFPTAILVDLADVWSEPGSDKIWASGYSGHVYQGSRSSLSAMDIATSGVTTQYAAFGAPGGSSVWTVGENGQVSSYDRLTNLRQPRPSLPFDTYDLWMASETELWVATRDGGVYSGDGSGPWTPQVLGAADQIASAIWGEPGTGEIWVRGYDGLSYYRPSSSGTWATAQDPSRLNFRDVWGAGQQIWSVGEKGYIGRWSFDDSRWDARSAAAFPPRPANAHLVAIQSLGCEAWAAGRNGQLLRRSGNGWEDVPRGPGPAGAITALWAAGPGDVWYARGDAGSVDRVVGGAPAGSSATGLAGPVLGLSGDSSGAIWAVGEDGGISRWSGLDWTVQSNPQRSNLHAVLARAPDDVWAAGDQRTVVSSDGGAWSVSLAPSAGGPSLRALAADSTRIYAVGGPTLYTRAPGGGWTTFSAPENLEAVAVDGQGRIWVAGEDAFLAYLKPDGGPWHPVEVPTRKKTLHGLSYRGGELLVAGDDNAIFIVRPPP